MRNDEKPFRVELSSSGEFRAWTNRSYPEGRWLLLCASTGQVALAVLQNGICQTKSAERRNKVSVRTGKEPSRRQGSSTFRNAGDVTNDTAGL